MSQDEWAVMAALARRFYLDDVSKTELATEFAMSRFRVARSAAAGPRAGPGHHHHQRQGGRARQPVRAAAAAPAPQRVRRGRGRRHRGGQPPAPGACRRRADEAAHPRRRQRWGCRGGARWSPSARSSPTSLRAPSSSSPGIVGNDFTQSPVEVIRRIADRSSVQTLSLFCPLFAGLRRARPRHSAATLLSGGVMESYHDLELAVLSLGSWEPPITQLRARTSRRPTRTSWPLPGPEPRWPGSSSVTTGAWWRPTWPGAASPSRWTTCSVRRGCSPAAGSMEKAPAIAAVARSGLVTSLVTDDLTAAALHEPPRRGPPRAGPSVAPARPVRLVLRRRSSPDERPPPPVGVRPVERPGTLTRACGVTPHSQMSNVRSCEQEASMTDRPPGHQAGPLSSAWSSTAWPWTRRSTTPLIEGLLIPRLEQRASALRVTYRRTYVFLAAPPGTGKSVLAEVLVRQARHLDIDAVGLDGFHYPHRQLERTVVPTPSGEVAARSLQGGAGDLRHRRAPPLPGGRPDERPGVARLRPRRPRRAGRRPPPDRAASWSWRATGCCWTTRAGPLSCSHSSYNIFIEAEPHPLRERLVERKVRGGATRAEAESFYERSDRLNVERVLDQTDRSKVDLLLRLCPDGNLEQRRHRS